MVDTVEELKIGGVYLVLALFAPVLQFCPQLGLCTMMVFFLSLKVNSGPETRKLLKKVLVTL
jgi:hypothetical protein